MITNIMNYKENLWTKFIFQLKMLRLLFVKHPKTQGYIKIPEVLLEGRIRNYQYRQ